MTHIHKYIGIGRKEQNTYYINILLHKMITGSVVLRSFYCTMYDLSSHKMSRTMGFQTFNHINKKIEEKMRYLFQREKNILVNYSSSRVSAPDFDRKNNIL